MLPAAVAAVQMGTLALGQGRGVVTLLPWQLQAAGVSGEAPDVKVRPLIHVLAPLLQAQVLIWSLFEAGGWESAVDKEGQGGPCWGCLMLQLPQPMDVRVLRRYLDARLVEPYLCYASPEAGLQQLVVLRHAVAVCSQSLHRLLPSLSLLARVESLTGYLRSLAVLLLRSSLDQACQLLTQLVVAFVGADSGHL
jgi:hypothetical protein